jgi:hypothetical protein
MIFQAWDRLLLLLLLLLYLRHMTNGNKIRKRHYHRMNYLSFMDMWSPNKPSRHRLSRPPRLRHPPPSPLHPQRPFLRFVSWLCVGVRLWNGRRLIFLPVIPSIRFVLSLSLSLASCRRKKIKRRIVVVIVVVVLRKKWQRFNG